MSLASLGLSPVLFNIYLFFSEFRESVHNDTKDNIKTNKVDNDEEEELESNHLS